MKLLYAKPYMLLGLLLSAVPSIAAAHPSAASVSPVMSADRQVSATAQSTPAAAVDAFHTALKKGDKKSALLLLSEDVIIFESGGVESNRTEYESHHLSADMEFSAATVRTPVSEIVIEDASMASVMRVENIKGSFRTRPVNSRSVETMMLRKIDGIWRIVHIHWSSANIKS